MTTWLCKSNTISILMHQMCIMTDQVSSMVLWSKKLEIQEKKCESCKRAEKNNNNYYAMGLSDYVNCVWYGDVSNYVTLPFTLNMN
jgi:hypothetical protein